MFSELIDSNYRTLFKTVINKQIKTIKGIIFSFAMSISYLIYLRYESLNFTMKLVFFEIGQIIYDILNT